MTTPLSAAGSNHFRRDFLAIIIWCLLALGAAQFPLHAQWQTQTFELKAGWNAVFLHVDAEHTTLDALIGNDPNNPIQEIWRWNPPATTQFTESPQNPNTGSEWSSWARTKPINGLNRLIGDSAYLVRVLATVPNFSWALKGKPTPPRHLWTTTGLNFIGFPTVPVNPPRFENFLAFSPELQLVPPAIFRYITGDLGASNPALVPPNLFRVVPVTRGQAFWVRAGDVFNHYFGPFEVALNGKAVQYGGSATAISVRLRNLTSSNLTINLSLLASEVPPAGQTAIVGVPPLLIRTDLNNATFAYGYTNLPIASARSWTLPPVNTPGSEVEVVLGLNRSAITTAPGALLAGLLRFTDGLGYSQVDVGVSATAASNSGLWVGTAVVNEVGQSIKSFNRDAGNNPIVTTNGNYHVAGEDTAINGVMRPYPLRLIVHNPDTGNASLLQRIFVGFDPNTNTILSLKQTALAPAMLKNAKRLSAVHLPWNASNASWSFNGRLSTTPANLTTTVALPYDDRASNPFLHTFHPDHDNLDATFKNQLPQGSESYRVERAITLAVTPPANNFGSLIGANDTVTGTYSEVIMLKGLARAGGTNDTRRLEVYGNFTLNRVSDIGRLTPAP